MTLLTTRVFLTALALSLLSSFCMAEDFPYRKNYPDVPVMEIETVRDGYERGTIILVDTRTRMEFDTIRPKSAVHLNFAQQDFPAKLLDLRKNNPEKKIVLYDNGITCLKSYIAVQDAVDEDMENIFAYDGGIQEWAEAYPADSVLMGEQITDPVTQLIPYDAFLKISLQFDTFKQKIAASPHAMVIDARDPMQRTMKLPGFEDAMPIPLDKLIKNIINKERMKDSQLFIFDQVGRQARWLMYYLEKHGYTDYFFLANGATSVLQEQRYHKD